MIAPFPDSALLPNAILDCSALTVSNATMSPATQPATMAKGITPLDVRCAVGSWPLWKRETRKQRTVDRRGRERKLDGGDEHDEDDEHHDQRSRTRFAPGVAGGGARDGAHRGGWEEQTQRKPDEVSES